MRGALEALRARIVETTVAVLGEPPDEVVLAPAHTVLKTSSGKIRRAACRELYEAGRVGRGRRSAWWQVVRLVSGSLFPQARRMAAAGARLLYGLYAWLVFVAMGVPVWILTALVPGPALAWRMNRRAARAFLGLVGIALRESGQEKIPRGPCVLVANHASYLDGLVLIACLPVPFAFVAKRTLLDQAIPRIYLRKLGAQFVERFDARQSVEDAARMADLAAAGASMAFFPEGTFTRMAGLGAFRLGAFAAAASAKVAVLPVAIAGTRTVLREGEWLARRGTVCVTFGDPLQPPAPARDAFAAAVALRDAARAHILAHCGEPDAQPR